MSVRISLVDLNQKIARADKITALSAVTRTKKGVEIQLQTEEKNEVWFVGYSEPDKQIIAEKCD